MIHSITHVKCGPWNGNTTAAPSDKASGQNSIKDSQNRSNADVAPSFLAPSFQEASLYPDDAVFLDRAIPDAMAYYRLLNLALNKKLLDAMRKVSYKKIFILDILTLVKDYARTEDATAQKQIHELITEVSESLPFPVVHVPAFPPERRVDYILENV